MCSRRPTIEMTSEPNAIECIVRIGDAPPPAEAIDRFADATWSHHADPYEGMVELGRRLVAARNRRAWGAGGPSGVAVLVTLRDAIAAEVSAAIVDHLPGTTVWVAGPDGDLLEVTPDLEDAGLGRAGRRDADSEPTTPPNAPSAVDDRGDPRVVSSDEIRMLLGGDPAGSHDPSEEQR